MSKVYTTDHSAPVLTTHSWRNLSNSAPHLLPHLKPNLHILDVGCGPGSITIDLAKHVPHGHVTGVEYVPDPLDSAREAASSAGVNNITFQVGDIHALPFEDDTFDIVHVHQVLQHVSDPVHALSELRRVTKKDGLVSARESAELCWYPPNEGISLWRTLTEKMQRAKGGHPHPGRIIHVWAEKAGFSQEKIVKSTSSWCFASDEERAYWGGSMEERARGSGFARDAVVEGFASTEEMGVIADGWRTWVEDGEGWFGLMHGEVLCWK